MGKGSSRRPAQVSEQQVAENWGRTFGGRCVVSTQCRHFDIVYFPQVPKHCCANCGKEWLDEFPIIRRSLDYKRVFGDG